MKRMILLLAALCFAIFGMTSSCLAESENESSEEILVYDSGVITRLHTTQPLGVGAETVRFTSPQFSLDSDNGTDSRMERLRQQNLTR